MIGEWSIFCVEIFLHYSQFFIKGKFLIGRIEGICWVITWLTLGRYIISHYIFYGGFKVSYVFSFVEFNVFVCAIRCQNINRCFSFDAVDAIDDANIRDPSFCWVLISNKLSHMFLNGLTCHFNWYNTIVSRQHFKGWFDSTYCCLLFTVSYVYKESSFLLYVTVFILIPSIWNENFFWTSILKIISVSSNLSQITKLWVNLKSPILRCSAVSPTAVIDKLSIMFNLAVVGYIGVLKLLLMCWYVEYWRSEIAAPESIRAL